MATITAFPVETRPLASEPVAVPKHDATLFGVKQSTGGVEQYALSKITNTYDLRHFGVVGDGTTDDTAAIAACFAVATAGSIIDFPAGGTVLMTSYVSPSANYITIRGSNCKIISNATGQDRKFVVSGRTGIHFEGLRFDGGELTALTVASVFDTYSPRTNPGTIHFIDSTSCKVESCKFRGVNFPITILGGCIDIDVIDNDFDRYYAAVYSYFSGSTTTEVAPKSVHVCLNRFGQGLHRPFTNVAAIGSDRDYTVVDAWCSGAIKFRGHQDISTANGRWFEEHNHIVQGNIIRGAGQMGIELQCCNDCVVSGNTSASNSFGVSFSYAQRICAANNIILDSVYCGIEVDGRTDSDTAQLSTDSISLNGNIIDGRDEYGRPLHWVNVYGIVIGNISRNIVITGGTITYCLTAIASTGLSNGVSIGGGLRIISNDQIGYGGVGDYTGGPWNQGIIIKDTSRIKIEGVFLEPAPGAWQRMLHFVNSSDIEVKNCTVTANNCCVYIKSCTDVLLEGNALKMGSDLGGSDPTFVIVDSADADCSRINFRRNVFVGAATNGIHLFAPDHTIDDVRIEGNDTINASASFTEGFLYRDPFPVGLLPGGAIGTVALAGNIAQISATKFNSFLIPLGYVTGTTPGITDDSTQDVYLCQFDTKINLQTAVGFPRIRKTIVLTTTFSTVTIHPQSGETINGSGSDLTITTQWGKITLMGDGSNWVIIE